MHRNFSLFTFVINADGAKVSCALVIMKFSCIRVVVIRVLVVFLVTVRCCHIAEAAVVELDYLRYSSLFSSMHPRMLEIIQACLQIYWSAGDKLEC